MLASGNRSNANYNGQEEVIAEAVIPLKGISDIPLHIHQFLELFTAMH